MVDFDRSNLNSRAEGFDAFIYFVFGTDRYRLKSVQRITTDYTFTKGDKYNDEGFKVRIRATYSLRASVNLILTAEDFDTVTSPPTDVKLFSYFLDQKLKGNDILIEVVEVFETKATANKWVRQQFTFDMENFGTVKPVGDVATMEVSGEILDGQIGTETLPELIRSSTAP